MSSVFFNFAITTLIKNKNKHIWIFLISIFIIFLLSSVVFISSSIKKEFELILKNQPDLIVQKIEGGKFTWTPTDYIDEIEDILGVDNVKGRVYGIYYFNRTNTPFKIIGVDFFENEEVVKNLHIKDIDIKKFLSKDNMIVSYGVREFLNKHYYNDYYDFTINNTDKKRVFVYSVIDPKELNILDNNLIIMDINLAKQILNIDDEYVTDISLNVLNDSEIDSVYEQIILKFFNVKLIKKSDMNTFYHKLLNYKGGFFLTLYVVILVTFMLILYQRYSLVSSTEKKEIGILRAVGWSISDVLKLKLFESLIIGVVAFGVGVLIAFIFVFYANGIVLRDIFLKFNNIDSNVHFLINIDFGLIAMLFLFYIIPFVASILIPSWKIATINPYEVMR